MTSDRRKRRPTREPAPTTTSTLRLQCNPDCDVFDFDERVEQQVDWSLWRALREGRFRLAVCCPSCQTWIHDPAEKKTHRQRCAAQAVQ